MSAPPRDDDEAVLEEIYELLEGGEPDRALAAARIALHRDGEDPVLRFLAGQALLTLDDPEGAAEELRRAVALDPEDPEFRAKLAFALFKACRFAEADVESSRAVEADPKWADALDVRGLVLERAGQLEDADACFSRAAKLDPERFPRPARLTREAFEKVVASAMDELREEEAFGGHVDEIAVTVEDIPAEEILTDGAPPLDPEILGLFVGTARDEIGWQGPVLSEPPRVLLFKRNLERHCLTKDELREEIVRTLRHEFAHYLGFEEEDMEGLDLD